MIDVFGSYMLSLMYEMIATANYLQFKVTSFKKAVLDKVSRDKDIVHNSLLESGILDL